MARIDYITPQEKQQEYFSDFLASFDKSPLSGDIAVIRNENSVKQSVRNLVLTTVGERLFSPTVGGNIYAMMFEPFTGFTADDIKKDILNTLKQNEPRISSSDIAVQVLPNVDQNQFTVNITFFIMNMTDQVSVSLILQRVR